MPTPPGRQGSGGASLENFPGDPHVPDMPTRTHHRADIADLFEVPAVSAPAGFRLVPELFSPATEQAFVAKLATLPFEPFAFRGYLGNRRIVSFGYRYDYTARVLRPSQPIPDWLTPLREMASQFSGIAVSDLRQASATEYAPGAGIGWHRDKPMFQDVIALSFLSSCGLRLRQRDGEGWRRYTVPIAPRSGYLLQDEVRDGWEHSIAPMDRLRYSVTFRSLRPDFTAC